MSQVKEYVLLLLSGRDIIIITVILLSIRLNEHVDFGIRDAMLSGQFEFEVTTLNTEETFSIQIISFFTHIFEICEAHSKFQIVSSDNWYGDIP